MINYQNPVTSALLGIAVGDALGVPVEFKSRKELKKHPITQMTGFGTYNQPPGTWSDDSSLTFCLAESLCSGYDLNDIALKLTDWLFSDLWRPHGKVFDIGNQTKDSLRKLKQIVQYEEYEELLLLQDNEDEWTNGNGSLMRIMPLLFYIKGKPIDEKFEIIWNVSALTHPHIRSAMACLIYLELAENILNGENKKTAYKNMQASVTDFFNKNEIAPREVAHFDNILKKSIKKVKSKNLSSDGYVVHSLEASLWCFMKTDNFENAVLTAVNLGADTDTTAAITGGLAGLYYGTKAIPELWIAYLARMEDIIKLSDRLFLQFPK